MVRPQRLLFEGTSTEKYYAYTTDENMLVLNAEGPVFALTRNFGISVSLVVVLASAVIRNVGISVLNAATDAERALVKVEMV